MRIKKGDTVKVISGGPKFKGLTGKILSIDAQSMRVILENAPTHKRHIKREKSKKYPEGGIIEQPSSVHISNVMLVSEIDNRPVRVGYLFKDGEKIRVSRGKKVSGSPV